MKRNNLLKHLRFNGCDLKREGASHFLNEKEPVILCGVIHKQDIPKLFQGILKFQIGLLKKSARLFQ